MVYCLTTDFQKLLLLYNNVLLLFFCNKDVGKGEKERESEREREREKAIIRLVVCAAKFCFL